MKLNPNCLRDLMLFFEEQTYIRTHQEGNLFAASYHVLYTQSLINIPPLCNYDAGEVIYHIIQLSESRYIETNPEFDPRENFRHGCLPQIYYVTPKGHEFIAKIKEQTAWEKTQKILKAVGGVSLAVIEAVSEGVANAVISQCLKSSE